MTKASYVQAGIASAALAVGALFMSVTAADAAPPRQPQSEGTIQANCQASGGVYGTVVRDDGVRISTCCPTGAPGEISAGKCSIYVDGVLSARKAPAVRPGVVAPSVGAPVLTQG